MTKICVTVDTMSQDELQQLIYDVIKDWVEEEGNENDHSDDEREGNFEDMCKQLSRWAMDIKDDYHKYVDRPME
tara:strand:+ start:259 stop:480 length:222 start_codon:yes stop_codon:yes gene_type:complete